MFTISPLRRFYPTGLFSTLSRKRQEEIELILLKGSDYYRHLSSAGRKKFFKRVIGFIKTKEFYGRERFKITLEVKVLISSAAIQLTFGLQRYLLSLYRVINVYPKTFYSKLLNAQLKGGTSKGGVISLSWADFVHGYEVPDDKYNLGLHEMAHALKINVFSGVGFDKRFGSYYDNWEKVGMKEFEKLKRGSPSFLRKYGGTNMHEFFAVCVEHFFEVPQAFHKALPDLYNHLCVLMNQNPLNSDKDYMLSSEYIRKANMRQRKIPLPQKVALSYRHSADHWSIPVLVGGMLFGIPAFWAMTTFTVITDVELAKMILIFSIFGAIFHYPIIVKTKALSFYPFLGYLFVGLVPIMCTACLVANYFIRFSDEIVEDHRILTKRTYRERVVFGLAEDAYNDKEYFRTVTDKVFYDVRDTLYLRLVLKRGLFGFPVKDHISVIKK